VASKVITMPQIRSTFMTQLSVRICPMAASAPPPQPQAIAYLMSIPLGVACLVAACLSARPAAAISLPGTAQNAEYGVKYDDRSHTPPPIPIFSDLAAVNPPNGIGIGSFALPPHFINFSNSYGGMVVSTHPGGFSRYFGSVESVVDPFTQMQSVSASAQGVWSQYALPGPPSLDPEKPVYSTEGYQIYYFKVLGGNPGDLVDVEMTASVSASGSGSYRALAEVGFVDSVLAIPGGLPIYTNVYTPAFSASAADGTGTGYVPGPGSPFVSAHPFTLLNGSLSDTGTIRFAVPAQTDQALYLSAKAWVYDQNGSTASALADPVINISPETPNYDQYSVVQSSNITPVPEIDPAGLGAALSFVAGSLGWLERRRLKIA